MELANISDIGMLCFYSYKGKSKIVYLQGPRHIKAEVSRKFRIQAHCVKPPCKNAFYTQGDDYMVVPYGIERQIIII